MLKDLRKFGNLPKGSYRTITGQLPDKIAASAQGATEIGDPTSVFNDPFSGPPSALVAFNFYMPRPRRLSLEAKVLPAFRSSNRRFAVSPTRPFAHSAHYLSRYPISDMFPPTLTAILVRIGRRPIYEISEGSRPNTAHRRLD
jgi:hypothetical protein